MRERLKEWPDFVGPYYKENWKGYASGLGLLISIFGIGVFVWWSKPETNSAELNDATKTIELCTQAAFDRIGIRLDAINADVVKYGMWSSDGSSGYIAKWYDGLEDAKYKCISAEYNELTILISFVSNGEEMIDLIRREEREK